mgnify:CR=1 FL=1
MKKVKTLNYESVNFDFTNQPVLMKQNVFNKNETETTLIEALRSSQDKEYKSLRNHLTNIMYEIEPDFGGIHSEDIRISIRNIKEYKESRRKNLKLVKYFPSTEIHSQMGYVVLDIDFKNIKELFYSTLLTFKTAIIKYFEEHQASVFMVESVSRLGFHVGMSFHAQNITNETYQKAYEFYAGEMAKLTRIENFTAYVDFSVAHIGADFFIGENAIGDNGTTLMKKPLESLEVLLEEGEIVHELTNEFTIDSYYANFLLSHYYHYIPKDSKAFNDYGTWTNMIFALVVTFKNNKECAYSWFEKFSQLADSEKINKYENDKEFERIFDWQPDQGIGVNYILTRIFGKGNIENYILYSFSDVQNYFESYHKLLQKNASLITENFDEKHIIEDYISEHGTLLMRDENIMLIAPPNSGKSYFYTNQPTTIFLAPTSILRDDLYTSNTNLCKVEPNVDLIPNQSTYIGNYNAIYKIVNDLDNLKNYTLVIDESHELFFSASLDFRYDVVQKLVDSLHLFKNFVLLTGTPFPFPLSAETFKTYYFTKRQDRNPQLQIVSTLSPLETLSQEVLESSGKQICYINNKELIETVQDLIKSKQPSRNVIVFSSLTKNDDKQQEVLEFNSLSENTVVLGTQMILEGISFKDDDITHMRFYQPILAEYVAQFSFRARSENNNLLMTMYVKPKDFKIQKDSFPASAYQTLERKYSRILENLVNVGIESTCFDLQSKNNQRRITQTKSETKPKPNLEFLPINLRYDGVYELDLLLLGQKATSFANNKLSIDIFSLLVQLHKWNFSYSFRTASSSKVLKIHAKETKARQVQIIKNNFKDLVNKDDIKESQKLLYSAWSLSKIIEPKYFLDLIDDDRVTFFCDKDQFKGTILKLGVWAIENELFHPILNDFIKMFKLDELINWVLIIKRNGTSQEIRHNLLMDMLKLPPEKIKQTKSKLKLYFTINNKNGNGVRSVLLKVNDLSIINSIKREDFEELGASPF